MSSHRPVKSKRRFPDSPYPATVLPGLNTSGTINYWGLQASVRSIFGFDSRQSRQHRRQIRHWTKERERAKREAEDGIYEITEEEWEESRKQQVFGGCFVNAPEPGCVSNEMCLTEIGYGRRCVERAMERFDQYHEGQIAVLACSAAGGTTRLALMGRATLPDGMTTEREDHLTAENEESLIAEEDQDPTAPAPKRIPHPDLEDSGLYFGRRGVAKAIDMLPELDSERVAVTTNVIADGRYIIFIIAQPAPLDCGGEVDESDIAASAATIKIDFAAEMAALQEKVTAAFASFGGDAPELMRQLRSLRDIHGLSTDDLDDGSFGLSNYDDDEEDFTAESEAETGRQETPDLPLEPQRSSRKHDRDAEEEDAQISSGTVELRLTKKSRTGSHIPTPPATSSPEKPALSAGKPVSKRKRDAEAEAAEQDDGVARPPTKRSRAILAQLHDEAPGLKPKRKYTRKAKTAPQTAVEQHGSATAAPVPSSSKAAGKKRNGETDVDSAEKATDEASDNERSTITPPRSVRKPAKKREVRIKMPEMAEISDDGGEGTGEESSELRKRMANRQARSTTAGKTLSKQSRPTFLPVTGGKGLPNAHLMYGWAIKRGKSIPGLAKAHSMATLEEQEEEDEEDREEDHW